MHVEVRLHAELARLAPEQRGILSLEVPEGARVGDILRRFALDEPRRRIIVGVNGESASPEQVLFEGARVDVLTPMAGGGATAKI